MEDFSRRQALLQMMQRGGLFQPSSEEEMHELLLQVVQFACEQPGLPGDEWDEFESDD